MGVGGQLLTGALSGMKRSPRQRIKRAVMTNELRNTSGNKLLELDAALYRAAV